MTNITVAIPEDVYRRARIRAAEEGTSVSALVRQFLVSMADPSGEFGRLEALQRDVAAEITSFRASNRLARAEVHDRAVR
jgi:plasmid stability protein